MAHDEEHHHHAPKDPPGIVDIIIGAVVFVAFTEVLAIGLNKIVPDLLSAHALMEMRLSGGLFFIAWFVIGNGIFKPFFDAAIEREEKTEGSQKRAQELRREAQVIDEEVEEALQETRLEGIQKRDAKVAIAKRRASEIVGAAQAENNKASAEAADKLAAMRAEAEKEIEEEAKKLAEVVASRALASEEAGQNTVH